MTLQSILHILHLPFYAPSTSPPPKKNRKNNEFYLQCDTFSLILNVLENSLRYNAFDFAPSA